ncbi:MAG: hypothetical protein RJA10_1693 [Pseudomonadota bacterium]|jgi:hypothetical protein
MSKLPRQSLLDDAGLNRQHVFDLAGLPAEVLGPMDPWAQETQLILFAHAGRRLWDRVQARRAGGELASSHPIDEHTVQTIRQWLEQALPGAHARFVYPFGLPEARHVGLQSLGSLAGWHHPSPFMVGIDATWGSWFAYRAVLLTDTALPASAAVDLGHPCPSCADKPCITACAGQALGSGTMDMQACLRQRLAEPSPCALACVARAACPVGAEHRYDLSQVEHSGRGSLAAIRRLAARR